MYENLLNEKEWKKQREKGVKNYSDRTNAELKKQKEGNADVERRAPF